MCWQVLHWLQSRWSCNHLCGLLISLKVWGLCGWYVFRDEDTRDLWVPIMHDENFNITTIRKREHGAHMQYLFANCSKIRLWDFVNFLKEICKRPSIHILQDDGDCTIIVERLIANHNIWTLRWLINFELLGNVLASRLLNIHLNDLISFKKSRR